MENAIPIMTWVSPKASLFQIVMQNQNQILLCFLNNLHLTLKDKSYFYSFRP